MTATTDALSRSVPAGGLRVLAGMDLGLVDERHADGVAQACAEHVRAAGGSDVLACTYPVAHGDRRGVGITVEVVGLAEDVLEDVLLEATVDERTDDWSVLVGERGSGDPSLRAGLDPLLTTVALRRAGRAVVFPGQADHPEGTTVGALLAATAIDRLEVLGGTRPDSATELRTRGHLRPRWVEGDLVLHVQPARGGALVPFEAPDPTPCCAAHG